MSKLTITELNGVTIAEIPDARATEKQAAAFRGELFKIIEDRPGVKLAVDFSRVEFCDSSFIGALLSVLKKTEEKKGAFRLYGLHGRVQELFELTRLYKVFSIYDKRSDALKDL